jgi:hypothetical protein
MVIAMLAPPAAAATALQVILVITTSASFIISMKRKCFDRNPVQIFCLGTCMTLNSPTCTEGNDDNMLYNTIGQCPGKSISGHNSQD